MPKSKQTLILPGLFFFVFVGLINVGFGQSSSESWSVSAANWMQYWYHKPSNFDSTFFTNHQSRQDSLDNRLIVDFDLGDFYAGAWLRVLEPNRPDTSFERIVQRYFGWNKDGLNIHVGNFYKAFDRGLTLNTFYDDVVQFDNNLDGVKISGLYDRFEFDAISARALKLRSSERAYTLRAVRGAVKPIDGIRLGSSYVRFKQNSLVEFGGAENINIGAVNAGINKGPFEAYAEYASKKGEDELDASLSGDGTYVSASLSHRLFSLYGEYLNQFRLLYPGGLQGSLNLPPPISHSGRSLAVKDNAPGERAYQIGTLISPSFYLNFDLAYSESHSRGTFNKLFLIEKFAGVRSNLGQKLTLNYHFDRFDYNGAEGDEIENYVDGYYYLSSTNTVSAVAYTRRFWPPTLEGVPESGKDYHEDYLTIGYTLGSLFQINIGGSLSNKQLSEDPKRMAFAELTIHFMSNDLVVFQGGERGGLVCSSGICSIRPTFQGTRVMLFSRF